MSPCFPFLVPMSVHLTSCTLNPLITKKLLDLSTSEAQPHDVVALICYNVDVNSWGMELPREC